MTQGEPGVHALRALEKASRFGAVLCGWALLGLSVLTGVEVIGRRFLGFSLQGVDEIGGYILAITAAFGFSWALFRRGHTRMDLLLVRLGSGGRALLNLLAAVAIAVAAGFIAWHATAVVLETIEFRSQASTPLRTPLIWPQSIWLGALLLFALSATAIALAGVWVGLRQGASAINRMLGPREVRQEIDEEIGRPESTIVTKEASS